jgi:hypothetical protein
MAGRLRKMARILLYNHEATKVIAAVLGCKSYEVDLRETRDSGIELSVHGAGAEALNELVPEKLLEIYEERRENAKAL